MKTISRLLSVTLVIVMICTVFAACAQSGSTSSSQASQTGQSSQTSQSSEPQDTTPIKFAFIAPLTGDASQYGLSMRQGVELRVKEFNDDGGLDGRLIDMAYYDDKGDAKETVNIANLILNDPDVWMVFGPFSSTCSMAISPILQRAEVLHFAMLSSHPEGTSAGDWVFRGTITQEITAKQYALFAYNELNSRRVSILYINSDWGSSVNNIFIPTFEALGGTVTLSANYIEGQTKDFTPLLSQMKATDPEVLYPVYQNAESG